MTMPMLICRSITSPSTIATTRDRRPLKPTIIGNVPRRDNWTTGSGWRKNECSVKTGWCVTKPPAATRAAKSSLGAGSEPSAGAGERARTHRHSLSRTELAVSRNSLGFFYGEEQRKGRWPFPCNPNPETYGCGRQASSPPCRQSSLEARLVEYENSCLLSRMVTRGHFYCGQTGDIPNVV